MFANLFGSVSLRKLAVSPKRKTTVAPATSLPDRIPKSKSSLNLSGRAARLDVPSVVIYFGSQTGRAEALANRLFASAKCYGYLPSIKDLYKFDPDDFLTEPMVIFILSTYTDGGATDNAAHFNFWINAQVEPGSGKLHRLLSGQRFAVFASGDSSYADSYNAFGIAIDGKLADLGGSRLVPPGLGDVHHNLDDDYSKWEATLWAAMGTNHAPLEAIRSVRTSKRHLLPASQLFRFAVLEVLPPRSVDFALRLQKQDKPRNHTASSGYLFDPPTLLLDSIEYIASPPKPAILHVDLSVLPNCRWTARDGDTLVLYPENAFETADAIATLLKFNLLQWVQVIPVAGTPFEHSFPSPCTVLELLTKYYECTLVTQATLRKLIDYATIPAERARLEVLATDAAAFFENVAEPQLSLWGVLVQFPSLEMSLEVFLHIMPLLQPRYLTLATCQEASVSVCVAVPPSETFTNINSHTGSLGAYFSTLSAKKERAVQLAQAAKHTLMATVDTSGYTLRAQLLPAKFLAGDPSNPIVLISSTSGFGVVRALLRERMRPPAASSKHLLIFSCKNKSQLPFDMELDSWRQVIELTLVVACAADTERETYLSDAIRANMSLILETLDGQHGRIFVSGKMRVIDEVKQALLDGKRRHVGSRLDDESVAEAWLLELMKEDRYVESTQR
ncbi:hypothetical protein ACHHYP_16999 [Achlya hypogyna]|uniref:NADPH--hemoprotein reductase n=1 Tax=Achlya hypogyna TaxID=1202772 RepID=A0A1V9ZE56_ACHHY|nr:hypothetical protein ACHHYP_16999 [Achlya hypogyna]